MSPDIDENYGSDARQMLHRDAIRLLDAVSDLVETSNALQDEPFLSQDLTSASDDLALIYQKTTRAIKDWDRVSQDLLDERSYARPTPREITDDHADRLKERYDDPVLTIALQILERNRWEWLWQKPETNGAESVRRHGLTENQRRWLDDLQIAWEQYNDE